MRYKSAEKESAIARNEMYYFTGKPCKHGHIAKRRVKNNQCYACQYIMNNRIARAMTEIKKGFKDDK